MTSRWKTAQGNRKCHLVASSRLAPSRLQPDFENRVGKGIPSHGPQGSGVDILLPPSRHTLEYQKILAFTKYLLSTRHCAGCWDTVWDRTDAKSDIRRKRS